MSSVSRATHTPAHSGAAAGQQSAAEAHCERDSRKHKQPQSNRENQCQPFANNERRPARATDQQVFPGIVAVFIAGQTRPKHGHEQAANRLLDELRPHDQRIIRIKYLWSQLRWYHEADGEQRCDNKQHAQCQDHPSHRTFACFEQIGLDQGKHWIHSFQA
jgi:hypothetical protein